MKNFLKCIHIVPFFIHHLNIVKFTLPYTLLSTKCGCSSKLFFFPCSKTKSPSSFSKLFSKMRSGKVSSPASS